jgi:hypothetical protein
MSTRILAPAVAVLLITAAVANAEAPKINAGIDAYIGTSDIDGQRDFNDGIWAAAGPANAMALPSTVYLTADFGNGLTAKASYGIGDMNQYKPNDLDRMPELYVSKQSGDFTVTAGKFWIPFAFQDWEWETKPGVMVRWAKGTTNVTGAVVYNDNNDSDSTNSYLRVGKTVADGVDLGVSVAGGKGWSYNCPHDAGYGLDYTISKKKFKLVGEAFQATGSGDFWCSMSKISYEGFNKVIPFIVYNAWNDASGFNGRWRSTTYGADIALSKGVSLQAAYAPTSAGSRVWAQLHVTLEKGL